MGSPTVKRIFNRDNSQETKPKLRVCAYCRVSSKSEEQLTNYETQVAVYTERITSEPEWEFAGIYADRGISATQMAQRKEFLRIQGTRQNYRMRSSLGTQIVIRIL